MKHMKNYLGLIILTGIGLTGLKAQDAIPAAGGNAAGNGGTVSYSIGQLVYTTNIGTNGSVSQGVQQVYEISVISGQDEAKTINLNCVAFPNPTTDYLNLFIENYYALKGFYVASLYDINGKLIQEYPINASETFIDMNAQVSGIYFIKIIQSDSASVQEIKTFKIVKN